MGEEDTKTGVPYRIPARVLALLHRASITIILCPETGLADGGVHVVLPIEAVPPDLRMPNSKFDVLIGRKAPGFMRVVRKENADVDWERGGWE